MFRHADHFLHDHPRNAGSRQFRQFYISTSLYTFALSLISVFIPIYLYALGYDIAAIGLFYVVHYVFRLFTTIPIAKLINRIGVKHVMAAGYCLSFFKVILLITLPGAGWPLWLIAMVESLDHTAYFLPYHIGVSKLKQQKASGKQLSILFQWNRIGGALGPLMGGFIAQAFGVAYALLATAIVIALSIIPLTLSPEPLRTRQNLKLTRFPWRIIKRDVSAMFGLSPNQLASSGIWAMFLGIYVFTQDNAYLGLGLLSSLGFLLAIVAARYFGRVIDASRGRTLLRISSPLQASANLARAFIASTPVAYVFNLLVQPVMLGVSLPYQHGEMARGDELAKNRILYMTIMETINYIPKALLWLAVFIIADAGHEKFSLQFVFLAAIPAAWLVLSERFKSLNVPTTSASQTS